MCMVFMALASADSGTGRSRKAVGVVHLNDGGTTARDGRVRGKEHRDLRPALENIDHQVAAFHMAVKGGDEVTVPASGQVGTRTNPALRSKRFFQRFRSNKV